MITLKKELTEEEVELLTWFLESQEESYWILEQKEPRDPFYLFGYFDKKNEATDAFRVLLTDVQGLTEGFELETLEDQDWKEAYKLHLKYWSDRHLHWIPLWEKEDRAAPEGQAFIYLDSGMAFGTGAHETTRLCARRLVDFAERHASFDSLNIVDAGCGSGILALSARALGFQQVSGFDFDPEAVRIADEHNDFNAHLSPIPFSVGSVPDDLEAASADLLLANIQTNILVPCATALVSAVAPGGTLALSGILKEEIDRVSDAIRAAAKKSEREIKEEDSRIDGQWADLLVLF